MTAAAPPEPVAGAALGTDRTKEIGRFGAPTGGRPQSGAAPRPAPSARVFLAALPVVLKPDLYRRLGIALGRDRAHNFGKVYGMARSSASSSVSCSHALEGKGLMAIKVAVLGID